VIAAVPIPSGMLRFSASPAGVFEHPICRVLSRSIPNEAVELYVTAVLWDLLDPANEPSDTLGGLGDRVFQIFDQELDVAPGTGPWPTLTSFRSAWAARGFSTTALDQIMSGIRIRGSLPEIEPLPEEPPTDHICNKPAPPPSCDPPK
jgi:hypothetical protein